MFAFTYYSISALINFVFSLLATLTLFVPDKKNIIEKKLVNAFLRLAFFVIFWSGYYFLWQISTTEESALFNAKLLASFVAFIPIAYLDYSVTFLGINNKKTRFFIAIGYVVTMFFVFSGLVDAVSPKLDFLFWPVGTKGFSVFILYWIFIFLLSPVLFIFSLGWKNKAIDKRYIMLSVVASVVGIFGFINNFFLWFDINVPPLGNILVAVFFFMTIYIVRRYNVSNLRLFYIQLPALIISMFAFGRILVSGTNFDLYTNILFFFIMAVASIYIIASSNEQEKTQVILEKTIHDMKLANAKLVEIDKHKSDFVSIAAHQLRTPSGVVRSYAEMINDGTFGKVPKYLKEPVAGILENGMLLAETISTILSISHIENGRKMNFEKVDMVDLLKKDVPVYEFNAKNKKIEFNFSYDPKGKYAIPVDLEKIKNVFTNIVDNAIKYTDVGSVGMRIYEDGSNVCISVSDTGRGMSKKFIDTQLYQKFAREDSITKDISGNGLGMYFVKEVIDLHHGGIIVNSKENKGTEFTVVLPKKQQVTKKSVSKKRSSKKPATPDF